MRRTIIGPMKMAAYLLFSLVITQAHAQTSALPSWNDGKSKQSIVEFVKRVTTKAQKTSSSPPNGSRYSTTTARFGPSSRSISSSPSPYWVKTLAPQHPEWKEKEPFASLIKGDVKGALAGGEKALVEIIMATHAGTTTEEFEDIVRDWLTTAKHSKTGRRYNEMIYQPMVELLLLPARKRIQDVYRFRRRRRNSCGRGWRRPTASCRAGSREHD